MEHYKYLSEAEWDKEIRSFNLIITDFLVTNGYSCDDISCLETTVFQIITKVDQRKKYFQFFHHLEISDFKELALYCFWIIKLKPLFSIKKNATEQDKIAFESLNEKFALFYIIKKFRALIGNNDQLIDSFFSDEYMYELIYSFTYRDLSKESMILLIETIAIAFGFNPYQKSKR